MPFLNCRAKLEQIGMLAKKLEWRQDSVIFKHTTDKLHLGLPSLQSEKGFAAAQATLINHNRIKIHQEWKYVSDCKTQSKQKMCLFSACSAWTTKRWMTKDPNMILLYTEIQMGLNNT